MSHDRLLRYTRLNVEGQQVLSRRDWLKVLPALGLGAGLMSWTDWLAAQTDVLSRKRKHCILLWMTGGPSQFETFSPVAASAREGGVKPIPTAVPGIQISEFLPRVAERLDDICIIRSMTSKEGSHPRASYLLRTGYLPNPSVRFPSLGAHAVQQLADTTMEALPAYVQIGRAGRDNASAGFLGVELDPFVVASPTDPPENTQLMVDEGRHRRRLELSEALNRNLSRRGLSREAKNQISLYKRSTRMIRSPDMAAFDLEREPEKARSAYGDSAFGAGCLLARRLVESGVTFVEVRLGNWDTHQDNLNGTRQLCEQLDQPYAVLLQDLKQRGLLEDTLVVWMGEFGRTPRINPRGGRDHYPRAFTVALAGCGVRGGQVIGRLDPSGATILEQPVTVPDLCRSICHALQVDPDREFVANGRPVKVVDGGTLVPGLLAS